MNPQAFSDDDDFNTKKIDMKDKSNTKVENPLFSIKGVIKSNDEDGTDENVKRNDFMTRTEEVSKGLLSNINTKLSFIGEYFNVDKEEIFYKLVHSLIPFNKDFHYKIENKPDLYGPYWIVTSLILQIIILGNLSRYFESSQDKNKFTYRFDFIPIATCFIYGFSFGVPIILTFISRFILKIEIKHIIFISIYGYSYMIFLIILPLCLIPYDLVKYIMFGYGLVSSSGFIILNLFLSLDGKAGISKYFVLGIVVFLQFILYFTVKMYFFGGIIS